MARKSEQVVDAEFVPGTVLTAALEEILVKEELNKRTYQPSIKEIRKLADSIKEGGQIQPVVVEPYESVEGEISNGFKWLLNAGFQRLRAFKLLQDEDGVELPIEIKIRDTRTTAGDVNMSENVFRNELTLIDHANNLKDHITEGGTASSFAAKIGKTPAYVHYIKKLLDLRPAIQKRINESTLPFDLVKNLPVLSEEEQDKAIADYDAGNVKGAVGAAKGKRKAGKRGKKAAGDETTTNKGISSKKAVLEIEERLALLKEVEKPNKAQDAAVELYKALRKYLSGGLGAQALDNAIMKLL